MEIMNSSYCIGKMQEIAGLIDEENGTGAADEMFTFVFHFVFRMAQNWWGLPGAERKRNCEAGK